MYSRIEHTGSERIGTDQRRMTREGSLKIDETDRKEVMVYGSPVQQGIHRIPSH
jgi:hypothetical protein